MLFIIIYLYRIISCGLEFAKILSGLRKENDKYMVHATDRLHSDKFCLDRYENRNCSSNTASNYKQVLYIIKRTSNFKTICMF